MAPYLPQSRAGGGGSPYSEGGNYFRLRLQGEVWGWTSFFIGVAAVGIGSSYYHLKPNDATLVWDRLPMTIVFTSIMAIFIIERVDEQKGTVSILPLLLAGVIRILYWRLRGAMLLLQRKFKPPQIPEDLNTAIKSGKVRAPTHIISTISDDRGEEPCYAGIPMSSIVEHGYGVGDVISLLWFKRSLPRYCTRFIEICVMLCADHGPCVSGAHNTIVTARAGKDLVSSLVSGLLTIGPRFGGAIDDVARYFKDAYDKKISIWSRFAILA